MAVSSSAKGGVGVDLAHADIRNHRGGGDSSANGLNGVGAPLDANVDYSASQHYLNRLSQVCTGLALETGLNDKLTVPGNISVCPALVAQPPALPLLRS